MYYRYIAKYNCVNISLPFIHLYHLCDICVQIYDIYNMDWVSFKYITCSNTVLPEMEMLKKKTQQLICALVVKAFNNKEWKLKKKHVL